MSKNSTRLAYKIDPKGFPALFQIPVYQIGLHCKIMWISIFQVVTIWNLENWNGRPTVLIPAIKPKHIIACILSRTVRNSIDNTIYSWVHWTTQSMFRHPICLKIVHYRLFCLLTNPGGGQKYILSL